VIDLVRAELFKARATRSVWGLAALAVAFCLLWAVLDVLVFMDLGDGVVTDRSIRDAYGMAQQGYLLVLILGIVVTAGEYRHRTITWAFLATPRRGRVITAKLAACGLLGLLIGVAAAVVTGAATAALLAATGRPLLAPGVAPVLAGSVLATGLWGVLGAALGVLVRNQVAATVIAFVWFFYAEWLLVQLLPEVGRWVPTGAAKAIIGYSREGLVDFSGQPVPGELLPVWAGAALLLGYAFAAAFAAHRVTVRRDVT
jgi:ABC-2 type transport system permease protein